MVSNVTSAGFAPDQPPGDVLLDDTTWAIAPDRLLQLPVAFAGRMWVHAIAREPIARVERLDPLVNRLPKWNRLSLSQADALKQPALF
jgi:hypothetical protein